MHHVHVEAAKNIKNVVADRAVTMSELRVKGFMGAAEAAGIKYKDRLDLGLIYSEAPACAAAVFTRNDVKAAPVLDGIRKMTFNRRAMRAILVNSGNANACTGSEGVQASEKAAGLVASAIGCSENDVFVSSTGVIGVPLPMEKFEAAIPRLAASLSLDGLDHVADAILTTDTVRKTSARKIEINGIEINMAGMAKGAGMIGPNMGPPSATMLAFILADAPVEAAWWQVALNRAADASFNSIIVDGDTSTNDTVIALANGMATDMASFSEKDRICLKDKVSDAMMEISMDLARQIVLDGEGATKCVDVTVSGALTEGDAEKAARTIACSPLVKTAFFGNDPNWGRIFAAAGRAGINMNPEKADLYVGDVLIAAQGRGTGPESEKEAAATMQGREFSVRLELNLGDKLFTVVTTDLSDQYVHINADYRT